MKRKILILFNKFLLRLITLNKKSVFWDEIQDNFISSYVSTKSKIYGPSHLIDSIVGDYSYISPNSRISHTAIGKYCSIGPNLISGWGMHPIDGISTAPMFYSTRNQNGVSLTKVNKTNETKQIIIGNDVFIGANVTILNGVEIGNGAVIGAGAVVSKNIPDYAIAIGCPIRIVRYRFSETQINSLLKIKWWEFDEVKLSDVEKMFFEVDKFIEKYESA